MTQELAIKWVMSAGVLKLYGPHTMALFKFIGSRHMQSFGLPDLSLPSTSMKLFIHGVASLASFMIPAWSILSISFWRLLSDEWAPVDMGFVLVWCLGQPVCDTLIQESCWYLQRHLGSLIIFVLCLLSWCYIWLLNCVLRCRCCCMALWALPLSRYFLFWPVNFQRCQTLFSLGGQ